LTVDNNNKKYVIAGLLVVALIAGFSFFSSGLSGATTVSTTDGPSNLNQENSIQDTYNSLSPKAKALYFDQSEELTIPVPERIVELDQLQIGCFGPDAISQLSTDTNLGGQCCGALKDGKAYEIQLQVLEKFIEDHGSIDIIPKDPYDISVEHANTLTNFDSLTLSDTQQQVYDESLQLSHHGPCCCKCWKWYVMSGLGKKLIVEYNFTAEDVAELWDLSSSCGHAEDTNMNEHYNE